MASNTWISDFQWPEPEDEQDRELLNKVRIRGWTALHVEGELGRPAYYFTTGHYLHYGQPEVLIMGAPKEVAEQLLIRVALHMRGPFQPLEVGRKYDYFCEDLSVALLPVSIGFYNEYLGFNNWFYGSLDHVYPAVQLVWSDMEGNLPWQEGYDKRFHRLQPLLGDESWRRLH